MRIAVFDPFCGISGNMVLGALMDAGLSPGRLEGMLRGLDLPGWEISVDRVLRNGLQGTLVNVAVPVETNHRQLPEILGIISRSDLPDTVRKNSALAFEKLAEAESFAHAIPVDQVHFHETGAMDAIIDITGSFCGLYLMGVERVFSSPVATGTGTVECAHGILPVPAPATLRILEGLPTVPSGIPFEITTPTGAAILATAVGSWSEVPPAMVPSETGYGAGERELPRPNLLRITLGETLSREAWGNEQCVEIKTVLDDMDPRIWPDVASEILRRGAVDCYGAMCIGKKGRPALEMTVICHEPSVNDVIRCIFTGTTTLGVRISSLGRAVLDRDFKIVNTRFGPVSVKRAFLDGELLRTEPEYDECAEAAGKHGVSVQEVMDAARCQALEEGRQL